MKQFCVTAKIIFSREPSVGHVKAVVVVVVVVVVLVVVVVVVVVLVCKNKMISSRRMT